jgi:NADPH-dependent 2,4-dienoyl-CoA reductase/sulfur reductase-like enzyme
MSATARPRSVTVVGASLAGLSAVRALREQGYDGRVTVVGDEPHLPYDRPPLSKGFLTGAVDETALHLLGEQDDALDVTWRLGTAAVRLDPGRHAVVLADGDEVVSDAVVLATGSRARTLPGELPRTGVHVLRTLDDARALRDDLARSSSLVVVGGGFIGAEVASSARSAGLEVTVVEAQDAPLQGPLGAAMGEAVGRLHGDHGVHLRTGVGVAGLLGRERVEQVELLDGARLDADLVVVGVGAAPEVEWLAGSGLDTAGGVLTDARGATDAPGVVAVGDCARSYDVHAGRPLRAEHWTHALQQPASAAAALLGVDAPYTAVPYVWSEQYGVHVQLAGRPERGDAVTVVHGSVEDRSFVATYERAGELVAVLGLAAPGPFGKQRRRLRAAAAERLARQAPTAPVG